MTLYEAKKVLEDAGCTVVGRAEKLESIVGEATVYAASWWDRACIHGWMTADQLEAIAMWLRDPAGVYGATE